ncbi:Putative DnaJ domain, Chaperone J-domain superfamily [Colletotrichum destructivum]|uniref:DnaJ domain, Chaperone J-domain superfamily n=1 Tax=Colletotrichum destructivum TaxID=34406 RepID=A0AAX4IZ67_9PEZI|nr:Putative DnaJ domain, Chaperone J-domain superfamily [Colletotrichum destructivum]
MLLRRLQPATAARPLRFGAFPISAPPCPANRHLPRAHSPAAAAAPFTTSRALRDDNASANHYDTLKVAHDASPSDIKKSFYALSKTHHPDHNRNDPHASRKFHAIAEAYSVLGTPAKRAAYDRSLPSSSSSAHGHRRGSYHSTGPAGGRPASGLSRRRTTFRGPPPSFYRSGGWGAQSAKRREAHEGGGGDGTGTAQAQPGMGPGQDPYGHTRSPKVPHFDSETHTQTQSRQDSRRAYRIMGTEVPNGPQETSVGAFLVVSGILFFSFFIPYLAVGGWSRRKKDDKS